MFRDMKLGRVTTDPEYYATLPRLANYMDLAEAKKLIADSTDYKKRMRSPGGMLGNDRYGCCTCAAIGHYWQAICANLGLSCPVTEAIVLQWYAAITGFKPNDPSTDNGANMPVVLSWMQRQGIILAWGTVGRDDIDVATCIELFGGLYAGLSLPIGWQSRDTWDANAGAPGGWGGHAVNLETFDAETNCDLDTWDSWVTLTKAGRDQYCDERYAIIFPDWFDKKTKNTLQSLDLTGLQSELRAIV